MGCGASADREVTPAAEVVTDPYRGKGKGRSTASSEPEDDPETAKRKVSKALEAALAKRAKEHTSELDLEHNRKPSSPPKFKDVHATTLAELLPASCAGTAEAREWVCGVDDASGATYYYNGTTGQSVWEAPEGWDPITQLWLSGHAFGDTGCAALADLTLLTLPGLHLTALYLSKSPIGPEGARALAAALESRQCALQTLQLQECRLGDDGVKVLAEAVPGARALRVLQLDRQQERVSDTGASALARAVGQSRTLNVLGLAGNRGIGDDGARSLARAITAAGAKCALKELYLSGTKVGDIGAAAFADMLLSGGSPLDTLSLSGCRIGDTGASSLAAALKHKHKTPLVLRGLDLQGNTFGEASKAALKKAAPAHCMVVLEAADGSYTTSR